jgi:predicted XRE-type DNA-binding protein
LFSTERQPEARLYAIGCEGLIRPTETSIGQDLMRVQFRWPIGMPLCRPLGDGLWEVRSDLTSNRIARVFLCFTRARACIPARLRQKDPEDPGCRIEAGPQADARIQVKGNPMKAKKPRSTEGFTSLDKLLDEEGTREAFQAVAIKEVLAWQISEAMKAQGLSRKRLAERMGTSRSQVSRLLDPKDGNVTLVTLQRAAALLGRKVSLELV